MATRNGVRLTVQIEGDSYSSGAGFNGAVSSLADRMYLSWAQGTGTGQVDKVFADDLALTTTPTDLDLAGGSNVKDPASQADQTFAVLHAIIVENTGANNVVLGGDANSVPIFDAAADSLTIKPGGVVIIATAPGTDGWTVTAGTGDIIQLAAGASTTTARVVLVGR